MNRRLVPETNGRKRHRFIGKSGFFEKKCAGECTVLKFICMFAVLSFIEHKDSRLSECTA